MMESANLWKGDDLACFCALDRPRDRTVLTQGQVSARAVVVVDVRRENATQMPLVDDALERVSAYACEVTGSRPGADSVLVPGQRAFAERERNLREGRVPLYTFIWEETSRIAAELGVTMPEAD